MNIAIDAKNPFLLGWAARFVCLPRKWPISGDTGSVESEFGGSRIEAFLDGWDMCDETLALKATRESPSLQDALKKSIENRDISVIWVNDDNDEIED